MRFDSMEVGLLTGGLLVAFVGLIVNFGLVLLGVGLIGVGLFRFVRGHA